MGRRPGESPGEPWGRRDIPPQHPTRIHHILTEDGNRLSREERVGVKFAQENPGIRQELVPYPVQMSPDLRLSKHGSYPNPSSHLGRFQEMIGHLIDKALISDSLGEGSQCVQIIIELARNQIYVNSSFVAGGQAVPFPQGLYQQ
jgi:hypothetical protein